MMYSTSLSAINCAAWSWKNYGPIRHASYPAGHFSPDMITASIFNSTKDMEQSDGA